jgi:hypothetical protein
VIALDTNVLARILLEMKTRLSLRQRLLAIRKTGLVQWSGRKLCRRKPVATLRGRKTVAELLVESRR